VAVKVYDGWTYSWLVEQWVCATSVSSRGVGSWAANSVHGLWKPEKKIVGTMVQKKEEVEEKEIFPTSNVHRVELYFVVYAVVCARALLSGLDALRAVFDFPRLE